MGSELYFILIGEPPDSARPTLHIINGSRSVEITEISTLPESEVPYKGCGTLTFGLCNMVEKRIGVCLGRSYGAGTHQGKEYVSFYPWVEEGDTDILAQYARLKCLQFDGITTLQELEASLQTV